MNKKVICCLLIILSLFLTTGCDKHSGKSQFEKIYYSPLENVKEEKKNDGELETGVKWNSIRYTLDGIVVTITRYENIQVDVAGGSNDLEDKTISNIKYKYKSSTINKVLQDQYYTQVGEDSYYISITYKDTSENKKVIDKFLKSIEVDEK